LQLNLSKSQRLAITVAFFLGGWALFLLLGESYLSYAIEVAYYFVGAVFLARYFGGVVQEKTYGFPYPKERVCEIIPRVVKDYYVWRKKVLCSDIESGHFSFQFGWWKSSVLAVDVNGIDDKSCAVKVRCEMKQLFDWNMTERMVIAFFNKLNATLTEGTAVGEGKSHETGYRPWESLSKYEQTVGSLLAIGGVIIIVAGLGSLSASQYSLNAHIPPVGSLAVVIFGIIIVLIGLIWFIVKTRAWNLSIA